ncbi:proline-rich membrane anchor 1-like isoform X1 [Acipenser oxyrinchus oxyrinchus]|uniref:Proline-rich membrane anchor 1-like isoform X1 n=1 Tax=Acipenser oxyrinchus oxyrinchus TaxID=40147 RepID=A0AAD8FYT3_ACIOX|nr:proline-rich membrane anchor 1-like isoform X1 [Acipenser oxyrinchus oxyrinchus]
MPWWKEIVVVGTVGCATLVFLLVMVIICYKAIKRKPLRKEENGTSRGEYAMASRNKKRVDANNAVV